MQHACTHTTAAFEDSTHTSVLQHHVLPTPETLSIQLNLHAHTASLDGQSILHLLPHHAKWFLFEQSFSWHLPGSYHIHGWFVKDCFLWDFDLTTEVSRFDFGSYCLIKAMKHSGIQRTTPTKVLLVEWVLVILFFEELFLTFRLLNFFLYLYLLLCLGLLRFHFLLDLLFKNGI